VIGGKAKFRVMDDKVRYFVSPGADVLDSTDVSGTLGYDPAPRQNGY
jgi:hypothetical protein